MPSCIPQVTCDVREDIAAIEDYATFTHGELRHHDECLTGQIINFIVMTHGTFGNLASMHIGNDCAQGHMVGSVYDPICDDLHDAYVPMFLEDSDHLEAGLFWPRP